MVKQKLPDKLYRAEQVRELDAIAIKQYAISGYELMNRAGLAAFQLIQTHWPELQSMQVFCGSGNNAGDGYIVARLALQAGLEVNLYTVTPPTKLHGDALTAFMDFEQQGGIVNEYHSAGFYSAEITVDALLGTGLDRPVSGIYAAAIASINSLSGHVVALDIPSGINADTGRVMQTAVKAELTITFIALKQGLFTADAVEHCGEIFFSSLDVPENIYQQYTESAVLLKKPLIPRRSLGAHKGRNGHVLVIGGYPGYSGAACLAAEAAARVGAGLVSVATKTEHAGLMNIKQRELMVHGVETMTQLQPLLQKASIIVLGPGLGQNAWALGLFQGLMPLDIPMVVDADGLNLLAIYPQQKNSWILTPHPGEAARLNHCTTEVIQADRFAAVRALQEQYGGVCVLKGPGSLIADGHTTALSTTGNPGMATGGMGDVLAGVIAGLFAQGMTLLKAAQIGVYLHGLAADYAAEDGERGMLASDLMPHLRRLVNDS